MPSSGPGPLETTKCVVRTWHGKNSTNLSETTELEAHAVHTMRSWISFFPLLILFVSLPTFRLSMRCFALLLPAMIFSYTQQLETYICKEPNLYGCLHLSSIVLCGYPFGGVDFVQLFCTLKLSSMSGCFATGLTSFLAFMIPTSEFQSSWQHSIYQRCCMRLQLAFNIADLLLRHLYKKSNVSSVILSLQTPPELPGHRIDTAKKLELDPLPSIRYGTAR